STNVSIVSGPTLSNPVGADWSYALTVNFTGGTGFIQFYARLAAGAHLNASSSLIIGSLGKMGQLQVQKPIANLGAPDLSIVKSGPPVAAPSDLVTYTLSYTNGAAGTNSATGVQISDILPPQLLVTTNNIGGGALVGNTIFWDLDSVPPGTSGVVSFQARVDPGLSNQVTTVTLTNVAQILSSENDANSANNSSTYQTIVSSGCLPFSVGYPYASTNPLTSIDFNESEILRGFNTKLVGLGDTIKVWYNDEHALLLGIRRVVVKTATGSTTNDYPLTPLATNPGSATNPAVGTLALAGDQAGTDL